MKTALFILILGLMGLSACKKDESIEPLGSSPKLLVSIMENNLLITDFKYDSLNRLIQLNNYHADTISYSENYQYDSDNKLIQRIFAGFIETYEYTRDGKLLTTKKYYNPTGKVWNIEYQYDKGRIIKGITFYEGTQTGYIVFKYDSQGNTIERTEYPNSPDLKGFKIEQFKIDYDTKINPVKNLCLFPADIVQKNNPTYFYHYLAVMSSLPPEYHSTYDYDTLGIPTKEYRDSRTFIYNYIDKRE